MIKSEAISRSVICKTEQDLKSSVESQTKHLAQEICNYLSVPLGDALVTSFSHNESFVRFNENIRGTDVFLVQSTSSPANHNVMELLIMIDAAKRASAARVTAVLPFLVMQDRTEKINPRVRLPQNWLLIFWLRLE